MAVDPTTHVPRDYPNGAVVAVTMRENRFLTIKRSKFVKAPGTICFAGGGVEPDEEQSDAIVREMQEELGVEVTAVACVFTGRTPQGVELNFWQVDLPEGETIVPNLDEVESFAWLSAGDLRARPNLLSSAIEFLDHWEAGQIQLVE